MSKVSELQQKYNLAPDSYFPNDLSPRKSEIQRQQKIMEEFGAERQWQFDKPQVKALKLKWKYRIEPKFEGFIGLNYAPDIWIEVLDEFLDTCCDFDSNFRIMTIQIKYGILKISLSHSSEIINKEINELQELLFDTKLI